MYQVTGQITPRAPFAWQQSLQFLNEFTPTKREQMVTDQVLIKAVFVAGQVVVFDLRSTGATDTPQLRYTMWSAEPLDQATEGAAVERISFFLSLADDLKPFYAIGRADPPFAPIIERLYGYHQVKFLTPFENACWAVLTQRNRMPIADAMKRRLIERWGGSLDVHGRTYWAFPEATQLAPASEDDLVAIVGNARRAAYLHAVTAAFANVDEAWLRSAPYDDVRGWLEAIKGIGTWSAAFVLIRGLGRMEQVALDERLVEAATKLYGLEHGAQQEIEQIVARYGAWQGYWAHYLRAAG